MYHASVSPFAWPPPWTARAVTPLPRYYELIRLPTPHQRSLRSALDHAYRNAEGAGSPKFLTIPFDGLPWSLTPVRPSCLTKKTARGLLPTSTVRVRPATIVCISGLYPFACAMALHLPPPGSTPVVASRRAGSVLGRWLGVTQAGLPPARIAKLRLAHTVLHYHVQQTNKWCGVPEFGPH